MISALPWKDLMTPRSDTPDLLVVGGETAQLDLYRTLLSDLVGEIVEARAAANVVESGRRFCAVLVHLDGTAIADCEALLAGFEQETAAAESTPLLLVAPDAAPFRSLFGRAQGGCDFLASPVVPELLRAKVALLAELSRTRAALLRSESQRRLLTETVNEQVHRTKNLLAIVQSIALRTLVEGREIGAARETLAGRLRALARAYQLVQAADGKGTDLAELVEAELGDAAHRVTATGPAVRLSGSVVQTLALAIHELADNAKRHGALRDPGGAATLGWTYFERGPDCYLEIAWTERGGPPVSGVPQHGFGLSLVSSLAGSAPAPSVRFDEAGLSCRMRFGREVLVSM
jgi:two-component sensor histidine kinase